MDQIPSAEDETRAVYRLVHEVCELGADAQGWRAHFRAVLLAMVNGSTAVGYVMRLRTNPAFRARIFEAAFPVGGPSSGG
jgi:hypothetical protein